LSLLRLHLEQLIVLLSHGSENLAEAIMDIEELGNTSVKAHCFALGQISSNIRDIDIQWTRAFVRMLYKERYQHIYLLCMMTKYTSPDNFWSFLIWVYVKRHITYGYR